MRIIGIAGGIASGKSAVAAELATLGAVVLDADQAAHDAINLPEVKQLLVERWGKEILKVSGEVDRQAVAARVFSRDHQDKVDLRFLEQTLHPRIRQQFEAELDRLVENGTRVAVIDAPLLLEAGWNNLCHAILFVDSSDENRLERALERGWTKEEFSRREAVQMPMEEKRLLSTRVLANNATPDKLKSLVQDFWGEFTEN